MPEADIEMCDAVQQLATIDDALGRRLNVDTRGIYPLNSHNRHVVEEDAGRTKRYFIPPGELALLDFFLAAGLNDCIITRILHESEAFTCKIQVLTVFKRWPGTFPCRKNF